MKKVSGGLIRWVYMPKQSPLVQFSPELHFKEIVFRYTSLNSSVFLCFIDVSNAFDRINHEQLFVKLLDRGSPNFFVRIFVFWYAHQSFRLNWTMLYLLHSALVAECGKEEFCLQFYSMYRSKRGCLVGNTIVNRLMYADDVHIVCAAADAEGVLTVWPWCHKV